MSDLKARIATAQAKLDHNPLPATGGIIHLTEKEMTNVTDNSNAPQKLHPLVKAVLWLALIIMGLYLAGSILQGIMIASILH